MKLIRPGGAGHIVLAAVVMGSWAAASNWGHPMPQPILSGLAQAALAAVMTCALQRQIRWLAARFPMNAALWAPPVLVSCLSLCLLVGIHWVTGTPELVFTIAPPFSIGAIYAAFFSFLLWQDRKTKLGDRLATNGGKIHELDRISPL